mgnify:CR=1 FL=1
MLGSGFILGVQVSQSNDLNVSIDDYLKLSTLRPAEGRGVLIGSIKEMLRQVPQTRLSLRG